eukprot:8022842-Ditylum_brightwellii.AAC.1
MSETPSSEEDVTQGTGHRRPNCQRRTSIKYVSDFEAASRLQSDQAQAMHSAIDDICLLEED